MTFGLSPDGFNRKRLPDEKAEEENAFIAEFGDINLQPQSVFGQFIGVMSKSFADIWENLEDVYFSQYPQFAEGVSLDWLVALNGITRLPAERTSVVAVATAIEGTEITQGSLATQPTSGENFFAEQNTIVTQSNSVLNEIEVFALDTNSYNVLINGISNIYREPYIVFDDLFVSGDEVTPTVNGDLLNTVTFNSTSQQTIEDLAQEIETVFEVFQAITVSPIDVTFDNDFVTDNEIVVTINGDDLATVFFDTDQATTLENLRATIESSQFVETATSTGSRTILVEAETPQTFTMSISVTGGASQPVATLTDLGIVVLPLPGEVVQVNTVDVNPGPNVTVSLVEPSSLDDVTSGLTSVINNSSLPVTATDNSDGTFQLLADDTSVSFNLSVSANLSIESVGSPVVFLSENFGNIPAPINSLTQILTPLAGWQEINNFQAGTPGRDIETDAELRLRRQQSLSIIGASTVESIRARILQQVSGVTQTFVFENKDMKQEDLLVIFDSDFVTNNQITFTINSITTDSVTFNTDHLTTMQLIKIELEKLIFINSVTIQGANDRELNIEAVQGFKFEIDSIDITGGASQPSFDIQGGRFPKSFEAVVQGGSNEDIANKIWETKPAGIDTFGNTSFIITDSMGFQHAINFSRPQEIFIWVEVDLTLDSSGDFPNNGTSLVSQAIKDFGDTLNIGENVLIQKVLCQVFEVDGIQNADVRLAFTLSENDTPVFGTSDITISENELALFALDRNNVVVV